MARGPYKRRRTDEQRFWSLVNRGAAHECWEWQGGLSAGYGAFRLGSASDGTRRQVGAHRWVCEKFHGMRADQQALHRCDNKRCVNPAHLYPGSAADNGRDASERGRTGGKSMPGATNPNAKLTADDVRAIRTSSRSTAELAREYGVARAHVWSVRAGKTWGGLSGDLHV